jgi:hypothetical protein
MTTPPAPPVQSSRPPAPGRGRRRVTTVLAVIAVAVLAVGGILFATRGGGTPDPAPSPSPTPTASPSPTPSTPEQLAVAEASAAVLAYEQMFYDLLGDPDRDINDYYDVAAQPQLDIDLHNMQQLRVKGGYTIESTGPVALGPVEPITVDLAAATPTVTLLVCVDKSAAHGTSDGKPWTGRREESQFRVDKTSYLPAPGWAVAQVLPPPGHDQAQPC